MQNIDESELIAQSLNEDHHAYGELVDRYKKAIYHHSFAIVRDEDAAEDVAQDTFITAYSRKRNVRSKSMTPSSNQSYHHIFAQMKTWQIASCAPQSIAYHQDIEQ